MTTFRWVALGALFIIPFLPLYVAGDLFFPFISSKGFAFRILVEIAFGAWILLALADKRYRPQFSWTLLIYAALVAWMCIADLLAINPEKAFWSNFERMDGWVTLIHVFLFFVVAGSVLSVEKRWKAWWLTVLAASVLVVGHGFLQLAGSAEIHQGGVRVDANFGNAIYLAAYLLFTIAIAVWQAIVSKGWLRYALLALAALHTIILFSTATRGAILAFVGAIGLGALLWSFEGGKAGRKLALGVLVGVIAVIGGFMLVKDAPFIQENPILTRIANISVKDGGVRFTLWDMALKGFAERPLTGYGHEGFIFVFSKHYDPSLYAQEPWFDRAHSVYFDWLVSGGAPALLLFLALLGAAVLGLYRSKMPRAERVLLITAIAAYAFQALFVFDNLFSYVLLAAVLAAAHEASSRPFKRVHELPESKESTSFAIALPVVLIATAATIWVVNITHLEAGKTLIRAATATDPAVALSYFKEALESNSFATQEIREQLISFSANLGRQQTVSTELKQEAFLLAFTEMEKQIAEVPEDARVLLQYAQGLENAGEYPGALAIIARAEALSPKKQLILLQKGMVYWHAKDYANANVAFGAAYALDTTNDEAGVYAAAGRVIAGDASGANAFMLERYGTTTLDHNIMRYAYYETKRYDDLIRSSLLRVANSPADPMARFQLVQAYAEAGRPSEARAQVEETIRLFPDQAALGAELLKQLGLTQ